jgi:hypothetical protein
MTIAAAFILTGFAAFGLFRLLPQRVDAFNPQPDPPGFGMLGITPGQTIRINVVNTNQPNAELPPDPCRVVMTFRDPNGGVIQNANGQPIRRIVLLAAGQAASLDLNADDFSRELTNLRIQLRPDVRVQQPSGNGLTPPDPCIPTAEVINNNNGRTQFMIAAQPPAQRLPAPQ